MCTQNFGDIHPDRVALATGAKVFGDIIYMAPPPLDNEERRLQGGRVRVALDKGHPPRPLVAIFRKSHFL